MQNETSLIRFLGLGARAGKLCYGAYACEGGIKSRKVKLVVIDGKASDNTKKQFENACKYYNVPMIVIEEEGRLGKELGKSENKVIGVACADFAKSALQKYGTASGGE